MLETQWLHEKNTCSNSKLYPNDRYVYIYGAKKSWFTKWVNKTCAFFNEGNLHRLRCLQCFGRTQQFKSMGKLSDDCWSTNGKIANHDELSAVLHSNTDCKGSKGDLSALTCRSPGQQGGFLLKLCATGAKMWTLPSVSNATVPWVGLKSRWVFCFFIFWDEGWGFSVVLVELGKRLLLFLCAKTCSHLGKNIRFFDRLCFAKAELWISRSIKT